MIIFVDDTESDKNIKHYVKRSKTCHRNGNGCVYMVSSMSKAKFCSWSGEPSMGFVVVACEASVSSVIYISDDIRTFVTDDIESDIR